MLLRFYFLAAAAMIPLFLPDISVYPFSLGWSEASRYYYASLFFSEKIYGQNITPSTLHPTRYLLQSVPFIIDGLPLWFHRFWQVLLWLVGLFGSAFLLARRLKIPHRFWIWIFSMWVFLFLWQVTVRRLDPLCHQDLQVGVVQLT